MELALKILAKNRRGQTTLEYLLLLGMTVVVAYVAISGPLAGATREIIFTLRASLGNVVQNAEIRSGDVPPPGAKSHPGNAERLKPVH